MKINEKKVWAKDWIDANFNDGECRYRAKGDRIIFTPKELQDVVDELIEYMEDIV